MAAMACLLVISCKKDNDYASSILGSWEGYSRSSTFLKNGEAVTAQTFIKDMILIGEWESPEDDEEMADLIDYAKTVIHDEYLLKGDEDMTLIFEKGGKLLGLESGDVADTTEYSSPIRSTYHGHMIAYVRRSNPTEPACLKVVSEELGTSEIQV